MPRSVLQLSMSLHEEEVLEYSTAGIGVARVESEWMRKRKSILSLCDLISLVFILEILLSAPILWRLTACQLIQTEDNRPSDCRCSDLRYPSFGQDRAETRSQSLSLTAIANHTTELAEY
jgi:hypothetical protein